MREDVEVLVLELMHSVMAAIISTWESKIRARLPLV